MGRSAHWVTLSRKAKSPTADTQELTLLKKNILEYTGSDEGWFLTSPFSQSLSPFSSSCATKVTVYAAC